MMPFLQFALKHYSEKMEEGRQQMKQEGRVEVFANGVISACFYFVSVIKSLKNTGSYLCPSNQMTDRKAIREEVRSALPVQGQQISFPSSTSVRPKLEGK